MAQSRKHNAWNEVMGLVLLGVGTVLFLALISYTPKDVPSWVWFSSISPPNNPAQNFIGPTGAVIAGFLYMTLGSASYLIATLFMGFGGAKLFLPGFRVLRRLPWAAVFVISGAAGLRIGRSVLLPGRCKRLASLQTAARETSPMVLGAAVMLLIAAVIEAFWSSAAWVSPAAKFSFAAACWALVAAFLLRRTDAA